MKKKLLQTLMCSGSMVAAAMLIGIMGTNTTISAAEISNSEAQLALFTENLKDSMSAYSSDPNIYDFYITDLDQDGLLEFNIETAVSPNCYIYEIRIYEVNETMDGVTLISDTGVENTDVFAPDDFYDMESGTRLKEIKSLQSISSPVLTGYYDPDNNIYYYPMYSDYHIDMSTTTTYYLVNLTDDGLAYQTLGTAVVSPSGYTWTLADGTSLSSAEELNAAFQSGLQNYVPFTFTTFSYNGYKEGTYEDKLNKSFQTWISGFTAPES